MPHSTANSRNAETIRTERFLVQRLLGGEREAWIEFVDRYQRVVWCRINRVLNRHGANAKENDCDDVAAELFAKLLANNMKMLAEFEHRSTLATWLTIIAHRMALKAVSRTSERTRRTNSYPHNAVLKNSSGLRLDQLSDDQAADPLETLLSIETRSGLRHKLEMLKPKDRQVIELYHFENLGYQEIANRMGLSENSVGPRLTRAQRRLKRLVEEGT